MRRSDKEELKEWAERLAGSDKIVIVEGIKDKRALASLGIAAERIVTLGRPLYSVIESVAERGSDAVILTDLDREGKKLYSALKNGLSANGVHVDVEFREFLQKKTKLSHIEGISTYMGTLALKQQTE